MLNRTAKGPCFRNLRHFYTISTGCIKSCKGRANGDYQSCSGCGMYTTCVWSSMYDKRPCPNKSVWDDKKKRCARKSTTCF